MSPFWVIAAIVFGGLVLGTIYNTYQRRHSTEKTAMVVLPRELEERLKQIAEDIGPETEMLDVVRDALTVYAALVAAHLKGQRVFLQIPGHSSAEQVDIFLQHTKKRR